MKRGIRNGNVIQQHIPISFLTLAIRFMADSETVRSSTFLYPNKT
jgi:hypothetical protein